MPADQHPQTDPPAQPLLNSLWALLMQAFTVEDVFQRKIK